MRDVVIIGGGLSGLSAAYELERLKTPYRLIEVKKRLGGSILTEQRDGFTLDHGPFAFPASNDFTFLADLDLGEALYPVRDGRDRSSFEAPNAPRVRQWTAFKDGTQVLTDTLAKNLTGTLLHRMAVSSLGQQNGRFTICLENGLMLDAAALIVAAPARYVERMFRTLQPEISLRLLDYHYDTITRISLGYRRGDIPVPPSLPWDMAVAFYWWTDSPYRAPDDHVLLHVGLRTSAVHAASESLATIVHDHMHAAAQPVLTRTHFWPEADPLPPHSRPFSEKMRDLHALLPPGVALVGSDYQGLALSSRVTAGRDAARAIARWLESK